MNLRARYGLACWLMLTVFSLGLFAISHQAWGYEEDVHYGLTLWLAKTAGFPDEDATVIADQDLLNDRSGALSAPELVAFHVCLFRDEGASALVRDHHFPSIGAVPSDPASRVVMAGSNQAAHISQDRITSPLESADANLREFGSGLHPFQDSWSHQGEPDPPLGTLCSKKLSWGHPKARGGYKLHNADLTYLYVKDTISMAKGTYDLLCKYRAKIADDHCRSFGAIEPDVRQFAKARTKSAKASWFKSHSISDVRFLSTVNLPDDGEEWEAVRLALFLKDVQQTQSSTEINSVEAKGMHDFLADWFTGSDIYSVAKKWYGAGPDVHAYMAGTFLHANWQRFAHQLGAWRVRDHGLVVALLKGRDQPQPQQVGSYPSELRGGGTTYYVLPMPEPSSFSKVLTAAIPFGSLDEALLPVDSSAQVLTIRRAVKPGKEIIVGVLRPRHSPQQLVVVTGYLEKQEQLRVVNIESVIVQ
jgi:hypothetical protein